MTPLKNIPSFLVGDERDFDLEQRIFNAITLLTGVLGMFASFSNIILGFPLTLIIFTFIAAIIPLILFAIARIRKQYHYLKSIFLYTTLSFLSLAWFQTGGIIGTSPYIFLVSFALFITMTWGRLRVLSSILHLLCILTLSLVQWSSPHLIQMIEEPQIQFANAFIGLLITLAFLGVGNFLVVHNYYREKMKAEKARNKADKLLLNILPREVAAILKDPGQEIIADHFDDVTVLFADLVGFTELSSNIKPREVVELLNRIFTEFDTLVEQFGLEKIKTIGDAYMVAGGLPQPMDNHTEQMARFALAMKEKLKEINRLSPYPMECRIGIHCGPLVAGVIGRKKFNYDVWGDTVNVASRLESLAMTDTIQVSEEVYRRLKELFTFDGPQKSVVSGKGVMETYILVK